jgi:hypothetical protein
MKILVRTLLVLICALTLWAGLPGVAAAQVLSESLRTSANGDANGAITWTLRKSSRPEYQAKLGLTGIEHVRGRYDPGTRLLNLDGYRLDDPNKILGTDRYRMVVAENLKAMGGITWDHGRWTGRIFLRR